MGDGTPNMRTLIDELGAAALECRQLLADVRTASKDLRSAVREARETQASLAKAVEEMVDADIDEAVKAGLARYEKNVHAAMDAAVAKVTSEFDKLGNILLTGDPRARSHDGFDIRKLRRVERPK
jgi:single-stranded DNA-specific DHH superfamily exonuclease